MAKKFTREEWAAIVASVISEQPELVSTTVAALQEGIVAALDRRSDRLADVSMGLVEALNTKPGHVKRDHDVIVRAIEASNVHPTKWSAQMIAKEQL